MNQATRPPAVPPPSLLDDDIELPDFGELQAQLSLNDALPGLSMHEPTALLLDVNNLYKLAQVNNFTIDYRKLKTIFERRCDLRYCAAFSAVDFKDSGSVAWYKKVESYGYTMFVKELRRYTGRDGLPASKGNLDVDLAVEAAFLEPGFRHVIIGTCDGDFEILVRRLKERDRLLKVSVLGIRTPDWTGISEQLVRSANHFYDMNEFKDKVAYYGPSS